MGDIFSHGETIECPECSVPGRRKIELEVAERNYSGCAVDYGLCPECGKAWCISYKVGEMTRALAWDDLSRRQREEEKRKQAEEKQIEVDRHDREEFLRLSKKFT